MRTMVKLGVPYTESDIKNASASINEQAKKIVENLRQDPKFVSRLEKSQAQAKKRGEKFVPMEKREIIAMIAYLQRLGTDIKTKENK